MAIAVQRIDPAFEPENVVASVVSPSADRYRTAAPSSDRQGSRSTATS
jgi:hypothetical protein